jgi:integrator complex subunit 8
MLTPSLTLSIDWDGANSTNQLLFQVYADSVIRRMIKCCSALKCHTQVAVLCQFLEETDYAIAFKALQEKQVGHIGDGVLWTENPWLSMFWRFETFNFNLQVVSDAMDNYYDCLWDTTILEYLANLHIRRGEMQKHKLVLHAFGHLDLNPCNSEDILEKAAQLRKSKFMRALSRQYMLSWNVHFWPFVLLFLCSLFSDILSLLMIIYTSFLKQML